MTAWFAGKGRSVGVLLLAASVVTLVVVWSRDADAPVPTPASAPRARRTAPAPLDVGWDTTALLFRDRLGEDIVVRCPAGGTPASVWGSDVYSDESSLCTAALHSGRITLEGGGTFAIRVEPGQDRYESTSRNDVTTAHAGTSSAAFRIVGGPRSDLTAVGTGAHAP